MTTVTYVVAKGKKELDRQTVEVDDGRPGAEVTFTLTPELAAAVASGELDVNVGFMRGAIKMAGDFGGLLHVLPAFRADARLSPTPS